MPGQNVRTLSLRICAALYTASGLLLFLPFWVPPSVDLIYFLPFILTFSRYQY